MHFCAVFACNSCFKQSEKRHCVAIHCKLTNGLTETASVQTLKENIAKTPKFTKDTHGSAYLSKIVALPAFLCQNILSLSFGVI